MPTERTSQSEANKNKDKLDTSWNKDPKSTEFGKTNDPNYDPSHQNSGIDAGKPSNPNTPTPRNMNQDESKLHPVVASDDRLKASAKYMGGNPNEPIVTRFPTSTPTTANRENTEPKQIADAQQYMLNKSFQSQYDVEDMEVGAGLLIPVEANRTIDQTIMEAQKAVHALNEHYSVLELNDEGEEVSDQVVVHELKRNDDKTIQLDDKSKPVTGANHTLRRRRIQLRQYAVQPVTADGKDISSDGALIVRVF